MSFIVIAYYTLATPYVNEAIKLKESLEKFNEEYVFFPIESLGSWQKNTQVKASIIKKALLHLKKDILYVDVDAILQSPLSYYRNNTFPESLSAHWLDCGKWPKLGPKNRQIFDSSTMYFKYTEETFHIIDLWEQTMKKHRNIFDQECLGMVLKNVRIHPMPVEYVMIFDTMRGLENPVFIHYQASRRFKVGIK